MRSIQRPMQIRLSSGALGLPFSVLDYLHALKRAGYPVRFRPHFFRGHTRRLFFCLFQINIAVSEVWGSDSREMRETSKEGEIRASLGDNLALEDFISRRGGRGKDYIASRLATNRALVEAHAAKPGCLDALIAPRNVPFGFRFLDGRHRAMVVKILDGEDAKMWMYLYLTPRDRQKWASTVEG